MTPEEAFTLAFVSLPVLAVLLVIIGIYSSSWRRWWLLRKLDRMFEADREWWEEQLRDLGHKRPQDPPS